MSEYQADILDLIREAHTAQRAFDDWDEGYTFERSFTSPSGWHKRHVDLDTVVRELDEAVLKLIEYVEKNGQSIKDDIKEGNDEAGTSRDAGAEL